MSVIKLLNKYKNKQIVKNNYIINSKLLFNKLINW